MTSLFRQLLGDALDRVPAPVRALHETPLPHRFEGEAQMRAASNWLARLAARITGLPRHEGHVAMAITIEHEGDGERWTRHFPPSPFVSRLWPRDGLLCERLGPSDIRFRLHADGDGIVWEPVALRVLGFLPMPAFLLCGVKAREGVDALGRYTFNVEARFPLIGSVAAYEGWLHVE
ncbi:MAG: DUF4166 domain-containing protein [Lysobacteraceae bacterium]